MRRVIAIVAGCSLALGSLALTGCESSNQSDLPRDERGTTAGGNGAFGESPARPGDYSSDSSSSSSHTSHDSYNSD